MKLPNDKRVDMRWNANVTYFRVYRNVSASFMPHDGKKKQQRNFNFILIKSHPPFWPTFLREWLQSPKGLFHSCNFQIFILQENTIFIYLVFYWLRSSSKNPPELIYHLKVIEFKNQVQSSSRSKRKMTRLNILKYS